METGSSIDTLGDLREHRFTLHGWCTVCRSGRQADLDALIAKLGREHVFVGRRMPLRCRVCGSREVLTQISPPTPGM
ncbi:MAG: hypothetical protein AcusKO_29120 [Acuticoccus sp.]